MKIIAIGDVHLKWIHKPTFSQVLEIVGSYKPDAIVQVGDLYDFFSFSRFPKAPGLTDAESEVFEARQAGEEFWRLLQRSAPRSKCYQIKGNHCDRPMKFAKENAPELIPLVKPTIKSLYEFEGVTTYHDSTQELIINDIVFMHGFRGKLGDHCKHNMMSTVCGHSHRGGVFYFPTIKGKMIWEMNVGHIADPASEALRYSPQRYQHWTRGVGMIDRFGPRFIPLE